VKLVMLGCGTSTGVPRIGGDCDEPDWGDCDPAEPRNRRTRVSVLLENNAGNRLLIDTSSDLRAQLLANNIGRIDAVFWTHDHADHVHGIDELRPMRYGRGGPLPGFGSAETVQRLRQRFSYVFAGEHGYPSIVAINTLDNLRMCAGFGVRHCQMPHGPGESTGFRMECDGKSVVYATDFSEVTREMIDLAWKADLLVVDCLRREKHPTHANLAMALEFAQAAQVGQTVLTHMDRSMDYAALSREIPAGTIVGHDGLELQL
jgi:phosphoribosyl 1,2-cyclic phosphate phosphodiesterase